MAPLVDPRSTGHRPENLSLLRCPRDTSGRLMIGSKRLVRPGSPRGSPPVVWSCRGSGFRHQPTLQTNHRNVLTIPRDETNGIASPQGFRNSSMRKHFRKCEHKQRIASARGGELRRQPEERETHRQAAAPDGEVLVFVNAIGHRPTSNRSVQNRLPQHVAGLGIVSPEPANNVSREDEVPRRSASADP